MQIRSSAPIRPLVPVPARPVAAAAQATRAAAPAEAAPAGLLARVKGFLKNLLSPMVRYSPETVQPPKGDGKLRVASYNIYLGGRDYAGVLATLKQKDADVIGLQEATRASAERLARDLGMHVVFYGRKLPLLSHSGKAILSKYPIEAVGETTFGTLGDHFQALKRYAARPDKTWLDALGKELVERRGALEATVKVGDRRVTMLDTHLTLHDARLNALDMRALQRRAAELKRQGHEVVLVGDFNSHLGIKPDGVDRGAAFVDETDTKGEFRARYGKSAGNIEHPENAEAASALGRELRSAWDAARKRYAGTGFDAELTPEEARERLAKEAPKRGSEAWKVLTGAADGLTHLGANKRFDNILVSEGLPVVEAAIDMRSKASDHQAVVADLALPGA